VQRSLIDPLVDIRVNGLLIVAFQKFHGQRDTLWALLDEGAEEAELESLDCRVVVFLADEDDVQVCRVRYERVEVEWLERAHVGQKAV
jgi:hypothetical protein